MTATLGPTQTLPGGYDPVRHIVGSATGSGVWLWGARAGKVTAFHVTQSAIRSWPLLTGRSADVNLGVAGPIVQDIHGMVWAIVGAKLARLDPSNGDVRLWNIPRGRTNPPEDKFTPPDLNIVPAGNSIAVSADAETVATAMTDTSSIALFDTATHHFTQHDLKATSDQPLSVAYDTAGDLAIGYSEFTPTGRADRIEILASGKTTQAKLPISGPAWAINGLAHGFVTGTAHPYYLAAGIPPVAIGSTVPLTPGPRTPTTLTPLPTGLLLGTSRTGLAELTAPPAAGPPPATRPIQIKLPNPAAQLAVDHTGTIWIMTQNDPQTIQAIDH